MNTFSNQVTRALSDIGIERPEGVDFLTLHDILRLMPKIGEKREFPSKMCLNCGSVNMDICCDGIKVVGYNFMSHRLLDAFLSGDYPACEIVLLELLKEHA